MSSILVSTVDGLYSDGAGYARDPMIRIGLVGGSYFDFDPASRMASRMAWNGSRWVDMIAGNARAWDGSTWRSLVGSDVWDGSKWVTF